MTHNAAHIILQALKTPLKTGSKFKLYQAVLAFGALCFLVGYAVA